MQVFPLFRGGSTWNTVRVNIESKTKGEVSGECSAELRMPSGLVRYAEKWGLDLREYGQAILDDAARRVECRCVIARRVN